MPIHIGICFRFYTQMGGEKNPKAFAYKVPIGDYNYLQCMTMTMTKTGYKIY